MEWLSDLKSTLIGDNSVLDAYNSVKGTQAQQTATAALNTNLDNFAQAVASQNQQASNNKTLLIGGGIVAVLLIVLVVFLGKRRR